MPQVEKVTILMPILLVNWASEYLANVASEYLALGSARDRVICRLKLFRIVALLYLCSLRVAFDVLHPPIVTLLTVMSIWQLEFPQALLGHPESLSGR